MTIYDRRSSSSRGNHTTVLRSVLVSRKYSLVFWKKRTTKFLLFAASGRWLGVGRSLRVGCATTSLTVSPRFVWRRRRRSETAGALTCSSSSSSSSISSIKSSSSSSSGRLDVIGDKAKSSWLSYTDTVAWTVSVALVMNLAGETGLEPATYGFGDRCAANCATPLIRHSTTANSN